MTCHKYDVLNGEGKLLKVLKIGTRKDAKIAYEKAKALFGDNVCFIQIKYSGTWELN